MGPDIAAARYGCSYRLVEHPPVPQTAKLTSLIFFLPIFLSQTIVKRNKLREIPLRRHSAYVRILSSMDKSLLKVLLFLLCFFSGCAWFKGNPKPVKQVENPKYVET